MSKQYRPSMFRGAANRDRNEKGILEIIEVYRIEYSKGKPGDGYDLCLQINPMELWEIKDPEQAPSERKLTECEKAKQAYCLRHGIPYRIIEYRDQAQEILANYNQKGK